MFTIAKLKPAHDRDISPYLKKYLETSPPNTWDEQALPSYTHPNPLVRYVFWKRIKSVIEVAPHGDTALDFGSGMGALFPWLHRGYQKVYALDSDSGARAAAQKICTEMKWENINVLPNTSMHAIESASLDSIFALDVLEHIDELPDLLKEFNRILKPDGRLVVCSPTENFWYKFVRKFAGPGYQGEFHVRAAKEVEEELAHFFTIKLQRRLFPLFTFFRIVTAVKT